jgi:hypothetical protein
MLAIREIKAAGKGGLANEEWFVVENVGDKPFSTKDCALGVGKGGGRLKIIGQLDPGFTLAPGEKIRVVVGNPGKKAHGKPPEDALRNYHLFQGGPILLGAGTIIALHLRQLQIMRGIYDPAAAAGVAAAGE